MNGVTYAELIDVLLKKLKQENEAFLRKPATEVVQFVLMEVFPCPPDYQEITHKTDMYERHGLEKSK